MTQSILRTLTQHTLCLLAATVTLWTPTVSADAYRWGDATGIVNFSERKPHGVPDNLVTVVKTQSSRPGRTNPRPSAYDTASPPSMTDDARGPTSDDPNLNAQQRNMLQDLEVAEVERQDQVRKIRKDNCTRARGILASLSGTGRVRVVDENGESSILTEEDRSQRIAAAQQGIVSNCDA